MGLIKNFIETWRIERDKRREQKNKYRTEYAFTSGGTKYYRFEDIANLPYERGLYALCVYNEVEMRCSREYLLKHVNAVNSILSGSKIDIFAIKQLNDILKQRLTLTTDVELLYKLASVVFFDETENPAVYEPAYAEKKIAKWRKDKKVSDFFTQTPLMELVPSLRNVDCDLDTYTTLNEDLNKLHEKVVLLASSMKK